MKRQFTTGKVTEFHLRVHQIPKVIEFLGYNPLPLPRWVPEKLLVARRLLGLTQKAMAKRLGVDPTTLAAWEQGKHRPSQKVWKRVELRLSAVRLSLSRERLLRALSRLDGAFRKK